MLLWVSCEVIRASSISIWTNSESSLSRGCRRLITTGLVNPASPWTVARKTSAMPPKAIRSVSLYLPKVS